MNQRTIARPCALSGKGLHTGETTHLELFPAEPGAGIRFYKNEKLVGITGRMDSPGDEPLRCSKIGSGADQILTVEHFLAAVWGLGITNLKVQVKGPEIPALDGSAAGFLRVMREAGVQEQNLPADYWAVSEPIFCSEKERAIAVFPSDHFSAQYVLDYDFPGLRSQTCSFDERLDDFENQIAPSRTFCTAREVEAVRSAGLGQGADSSNTIVVDEVGSHAKNLRFPDECARHKILDLVGDLQLLGFPVHGRFIGIRSGHRLNQKLVEAIRRQKESHAKAHADV